MQDNKHGEPVALPERREISKRYAPDLDRHEAVEDAFNRGWNAYRATVEKLGHLYTHADPGGVEQGYHHSVVEGLVNRQNELREERDTLLDLLSEVLNEVPHGWGASFTDSDLAGRIRNALGVES